MSYFLIRLISVWIRKTCGMSFDSKWTIFSFYLKFPHELMNVINPVQISVSLILVLLNSILRPYLPRSFYALLLLSFVFLLLLWGVLFLLLLFLLLLFLLLLFLPLLLVFSFSSVLVLVYLRFLLFLLVLRFVRFACLAGFSGLEFADTCIVIIRKKAN